MRRTRIRRRARLIRQVGRCGETIASLDAQDAAVAKSFVRARLLATWLAMELGHDLQDVRSGLDGSDL